MAEPEGNAETEVDNNTSPWYIVQDQSLQNGYISISDITAQSTALGYDLRLLPLTNSAFLQRVWTVTSNYLETLDEDPVAISPEIDGYTNPPLLIKPLTPADTNLAPDVMSSAVVGLIAPWIDLASKDPTIKHVSQQVFKMEMAYAAFCGLQNIIMYGPRSDGGDRMAYARSVREGLSAGPFIQLHILMPSYGGELERDYDVEYHLSELESTQCEERDHVDTEDEDPFATWSSWDLIRSFCGYNPRLGVALEIPRQLPSAALRNRWYSEPVRFLLLHRTTFIRNAKGYPVLSKQHQQYLTQMMRLRAPPAIMLSDVDDDFDDEPTPAEASRRRPVDPVSHLKYIRHLQATQPPRSAIERFGQGFQDYVQSPLQPLADNLESITYEVFEKDPVKYDWYERAIELALVDLEQKTGRKVFNLAVVGSGRGPIVAKALLASQKTGIVIRCWAVEKNPNAWVHLQRRNATDPLWKGQVNVVKTDMRSWRGPFVNGAKDHVDVMVSELLGSFGDNELSPECLDGVQHVLRPETGISIPKSYTARLTPISTPRIYSDLLSRGGDAQWEVPAVIMLQQLDYLSHEDDGLPHVYEAWSFSHPVPEYVLATANLRAGGSDLGGPGGIGGGDGSNEHNNRYCHIDFRCSNRGVCHGLAGYFETVLYKAEDGTKVELSINPRTIEVKSKDMTSWFPIFFPLKSPLQVPENGVIEVSMWRMTDDRKVWYEWIVEVFDNASSMRRVAASELHSSKKHGCLM